MKRRLLNKWSRCMLAGIGVLLLGGCNLGGFLNRAQIGFAEQAGAFAFNFLVGLAEEQAGDLSLPGQGSGAGTEQKQSD